MNKIIVFIFSLVTINVFGQIDDPNWCSDGDQTIIKINPNSITPTLPPSFTPTTPPPPLPPPDGDRVVFWLHGLAGTSNSWATSSTEASNIYELSPVLPGHSSFSLATAASDLHFNSLIPLGIPNMQINNVEDPMENFIIAHSQGGIVSRATDKFYIDQNYSDSERMFGGIATFGSPHGGAQIINNIPDILDFTSYSCSTLALPFTLETVSNSFLGSIITGLGNASTEEIVDAGCNFISTEVFPIIGEDFLAPITEEYKVGAPALDELNATPHTIPRAAFHGVEDEQ